jgi:N6-adenosine-specific RNA methylase IME4/ParB-like chromosome segregation protein Spo0J
LQTDIASVSTGQAAGLDIRVDPEFRLSAPPHRADELRGLEEEFRAEGILYPVVVWKGRGILLDGHVRYDFSQRFNKPLLPPIEKELPSREHAVLWIKENLLNRRNLTDDQRAIIADEIREERSALRKQEQRKRAADARWHPRARCESDDVSEPHSRSDSRAEVAREQKISERQLRNASDIRKKYPDLAKKVRDGQLTLLKALRAIRQEEIARKHASLQERQIKEIKGVYDVIVVDPPWPERRFGGVPLDYPVMSLDSIEREVGAKLAAHAHDDCHVFIWVTQPFLPVGFALIKNWGLEYGFTITWHKPRGMRPPGYPEYNSEFVIHACKGSPTFTDTKGFVTCFEAPRGDHSEKPDEFYEMIRRCTEGMRRLDMFNRRRIEGFDGWGYEAPENDAPERMSA